MHVIVVVLCLSTTFSNGLFNHFIIECQNGSHCSCKILIMGDFNSDVLSPQLPECRLFKRFISNFDLQDMFTGPTRITESSSSHLDVFLINCSYFYRCNCITCGL